MKFNKLFLLPFALIGCLTGCNKPTNQPSSSIEEELKFDDRLVGEWYVHTSSYGVIPTNFPFEINSNRTLTLANYTLNLQGLYANFEGAYLWTYGSIQFITSYDDTEGREGVDWGYINTNEQDLGFARNIPWSKFEYQGEEFPNELIKEYLGTSLDIPTFDSEEHCIYKLDNFVSALYECKCSDIEIGNIEKPIFSDYLAKLVSLGYVFNSYDQNNIKSDDFYVAYDPTKTYSFRIIYFGEDRQVDIFVYNYMEKLHEAK